MDQEEAYQGIGEAVLAGHLPKTQEKSLEDKAMQLLRASVNRMPWALVKEGNASVDKSEWNGFQWAQYKMVLAKISGNTDDLTIARNEYNHFRDELHPAQEGKPRSVDDLEVFEQKVNSTIKAMNNTNKGNGLS
jgi:hypothetical protein